MSSNAWSHSTSGLCSPVFGQGNELVGDGLLDIVGSIAGRSAKHDAHDARRL
jgi:hypothetical protein